MQRLRRIFHIERTLLHWQIVPRNPAGWASIIWRSDLTRETKTDGICIPGAARNKQDAMNYTHHRYTWWVTAPACRHRQSRQCIRLVVHLIPAPGVSGYGVKDNLGSEIANSSLDDNNPSRGGFSGSRAAIKGIWNENRARESVLDCRSEFCSKRIDGDGLGVGIFLRNIRDRMRELWAQYHKNVVNFGALQELLSRTRRKCSRREATVVLTLPNPNFFSWWY